MKRLLASALIVSISAAGLVGCEQKAEEKTVTTQKTPGGGEVKDTVEHKVEKSGDAKD
jgi:uncharacterized lipoprotein YehR (DUF1307 family)